MMTDELIEEYREAFELFDTDHDGSLDAAELLRRIAEGRPGLRLKLLPDLERTEAYSEGPTPPATQRRLVNWLVHDLRAQLALAKGDA